MRLLQTASLFVHPSHQHHIQPILCQMSFLCAVPFSEDIVPLIMGERLNSSALGNERSSAHFLSNSTRTSVANFSLMRGNANRFQLDASSAYSFIPFLIRPIFVLRIAACTNAMTSSNCDIATVVPHRIPNLFFRASSAKPTAPSWPTAERGVA